MNMKPFGLAPLPHNMVAPFDFSWAILKDQWHSAPLPLQSKDEADNRFHEASGKLSDLRADTAEEEGEDVWAGDNVNAGEEEEDRATKDEYRQAHGEVNPFLHHLEEEAFRHHQAEGIEPPNRAHRPRLTPPPEEEPSNPFAKAWAVIKRWHPEDEGADISATFCEKCGRKLRGGDMDDSICNDCLHNSVPMDSPSLPFEKAWAIFKELNEEDAEDISPMPTTTKPKSPPVPDLSGPMRLAPDVDPKKVRWEDVYGGPPTKPPVPKPPVEEPPVEE